jgi:four helix bundle protein
MRNFKKYDIWIDAMDLVDTIYDVMKNLPKEERFGLISQITRSAVSIPSNIAEGASRSSEKDFGRFLEISLGSAFELETQLRIVKKRKYINNDKTDNLLLELESLQKRISGFRKLLHK